MLVPQEKLASVLQTSGPGATNLVIGLGDAMMDSIPVVTIEPWREQIRDLKAKLDFTYVENQGNRPIDPWALLNSLSNRKPNNAIICTDVGQHKMWSVQHILRVARHCGFTVTTMEMTLIETQVRLKNHCKI